MHRTKWRPGKHLPSIQPSDIFPNEDVNVSEAYQQKRPVSWVDSDSELLASGSEMGRSSSTVAVSGRRPAPRMPLRAHTVAASIRVELGERQNKVVGQIETPERTRLRRSASSVPTWPGVQGSNSDDIELDDMTLSPVATQNAENLVPCHGEPLPELAETTMANQAAEQQLRPDYKPMSLRWPFQAFLLALIAGLIAFLEYHIHDLPPLHYSVIDLNQAQSKNSEDSAVVHRPAVVKPFSFHNAHTNTGTQQATSGQSETKSYFTRPILIRPKRGLRVRDPDPRPPESEFPIPDDWEYMTKTYCGWGPPTWMIDRWAERCDTLSCDKFPVLCSDKYNNTQLQCSSFFLTEMIPSFLTDDPSWCPCGVWQPDFWISIELDPAEIELYYWGTIDRGCKSLMLALQSMHHFKTARLYQTVVVLPTPPASTEDPLFATGPLEEPQYYTTPPLPARGWWAYPSTAENGDVLMPLVVRTAGPEISDVFGNNVGPADIATFPEGFSSRWFQRVNLNSCLMSKYLNNLDLGPANGCTEPPQEILSTVWWTLPLGHPKTATRTTVDASTTPSIVSNPTSTAEVRSTSTHMAPSTSTAQETTVPVTSGDISSSASTPSPTTRDQTQQPTDDSSSGRPSPSLSTEREPDTKSTENGPETATKPSSLMTTDTSSPSPPTSSTPIAPIIGFPSSSSQPVSGSQRNQTENGTRATLTQPPAQFVTTLSTQFDSNNVPTRTLTLISSASAVSPTSSSSSNSSSTLGVKDLIPPPPFIIPPGTGWGPRLDNQPNDTGRPGRGPSPNGTNSGPVNPENQRRFFNLRTEADYLMASVLPVLLATLLLIPLQIFTNSVNSILPFRALSWGCSHPDKVVSATDSLLLPRSNNIFISQPRVSYRFLLNFKDFLPLLNVVVGIFGLVMVPLSSEVIRLEFSQECMDPPSEEYRPKFWPEVCAYGLRKSESLIRVAEAFLVTMAVLIIGMGWLLVRWRSGVASEPWSIASMTSLLAGSSRRTEPQLASLLRSVPTSGADVDTQLAKTLQDYTFRMGFSMSGEGTTDESYGIQVAPKPPPAEPNDKNPIPQHTTRNPPERRPTTSTFGASASKPHPFLFWRRRPQKHKHQTIPLRLISALLFTTGLLILILYYENVVVEVPTTDQMVQSHHTLTFEQFMNSQSFGVRILFTTFGVTISSFWDSYFLRLSESQIHRRLARGPSLAQNSILLSPPSNTFAALWQSILHIIRRRRDQSPGNGGDHPDLLSFNIALATFLAKFTPILLSNIPFHNTVTWKMHEACTWMAVICLSYMLLVLLSIVMSTMGMGVFRPCWSWWRSTSAHSQEKETSRQKQKIKMPVRVNTIAGAMYYICDSGMVKDFEGLSMRKEKEMREAVVGMEKRYVFWEMTGASSGEKRLGVDYYQYRGPDVHLPILVPVGKGGAAAPGVVPVERQL